MTTESKDFKVKHGLQVANGGSFGAPVTVATPTAGAHATTKDYVDSVVTSGGIPYGEKGADDGVATLDSTGNVPVGELFNVLGTPPTGLDTLEKIASSINNDPDFSGSLQDYLDTKSDVGHVHPISDVTDLTAQLLAKADDIHSHEISDVTGLTTELSGKAATSHTHAISDTTGLQTALDSKASTTHTHAISDTTGLQTALDGKASTTHTHVISDVTGLQTELDGKASTTHGHVISDITGLQTELDNKANSSDIAEMAMDAIADSMGDVAGSGIITVYDDLDNSIMISVDQSVIQPRVAGVTDTEIGYLDGVTSAIQDQIDAKASLDGAIFTGNIQAPDVLITGDLTVQGTTTTVDTKNYSVRDNMIYMNQAGLFLITNAVGDGTAVTYTAIGHDFVAGDYIVVTGIDPSGYNISGTSLLTIESTTADTFVVFKSDTGSYVSGGLARGKSAANPDIGFAGGRTTGAGYAHTGLFRDATDSTYKFFDGYAPEPDSSAYIDTADSSFELAPIEVSKVTSTDLTATGAVDFTGATITGINLLPSQSGQGGKFLKTDGSDASWQSLAELLSIEDLSDVTITSAATNDVVYWNGSGWVNKNVQAIPISTLGLTSSYTLQGIELGKIVEMSSSSAVSITIPSDAMVSIPVGTQITVLATGTGQVSIVGATTPQAVTVNASPQTTANTANLRAQWSSAILLKRAANTWVVIGDLA